MITCASLAASEAARCERSSATFHGAIVPLLGAHPVPDADWAAGLDMPQAFLVQQAAGWELSTHYHTEHQFQLVSGGGGTLGKHRLAPLMVHYASPEAGYGPIVAGDRGLDYYTLRARGTRDTWYLPQSRARMQTGLDKQHAYGGPVTPSTPDALRARTQRGVEHLMSGTQGLDVWMLRLAAGDVVDRAQDAWRGVRFYYVAAGGVEWQQCMLRAGDVASAQDAGDHFDARVGDEGAELLVMQFPQGAERPATPPRT